jgi:hypothetical protein
MTDDIRKAHRSAFTSLLPKGQTECLIWGLIWGQRGDKNEIIQQLQIDDK